MRIYYKFIFVSSLVIYTHWLSVLLYYILFNKSHFDKSRTKEKKIVSHPASPRTAPPYGGHAMNECMMGWRTVRIRKAHTPHSTSDTMHCTLFESNTVHVLCAKKYRS